ncbi:MAG: acyl carrier protein [Planctomycetota bacterium]
MADSELIQTVNEIFTDSFEIAPERLTPQAQIFADLELDSLDMVDLAASLQKKFGVSIRDDDRIRSVLTMQDLYDYLTALKAGK